MLTSLTEIIGYTEVMVICTAKKKKKKKKKKNGYFTILAIFTTYFFSFILKCKSDKQTSPVGRTVFQLQSKVLLLFHSTVDIVLTIFVNRF